MFAIVTDSSSNLPVEYAERNHIMVIPYSYRVNDVEYISSFHSEEELRNLYDNIRNQKDATSSQIPPSRYFSAFEELLKENEEILFIGISSSMSGSFNAATIAREDLKEKYSSNHIYLFDSFSASLGEGILVDLAVQCRNQNKSIEETIRYLEQRKLSVVHLMMIDNLNYLRKSGRISTALALIGSALNFKLILHGTKEGQIALSSKVRTRKKALLKMAEQFEERKGEVNDSFVGIAHADCYSDAKELEKLLLEKDPGVKVLTTNLEPSIGLHTGPDSLCLFFIGESDARNR